MNTEVTRGVAYAAGVWFGPRYIGWARRPPNERREGHARRFKFLAWLDAKKFAKELAQ